MRPRVVLISTAVLILTAGRTAALHDGYEDGPNELLYVEQTDEALQVLVQRFVHPQADGYNQTIWLPSTGSTPILKLESSRYTEAEPPFDQVASSTRNSSQEHREYSIGLNETGLAFEPDDYVKLHVSFRLEGQTYVHKAGADLAAFRVVVEPLPGSDPAIEGDVPEIRLDQVRPKGKSYSWPVLPHTPLSEDTEMEVTFEPTSGAGQQMGGGSLWAVFAIGAGCGGVGTVMLGRARGFFPR